MELINTIILPSDDQSLSKDIFTHYVHNEARVLLVVLGKDDEAKALVEKAAKLTGSAGGPRVVIWARKPTQIDEETAELTHGPSVLAAVPPDDDRSELGKFDPKVRAFALSLDDEIRDVIKTDEPVNFLRAFTAFAKAEAAS